MKKRSVLAAGLTALAVTLGVSGVIGASVAATGNASLSNHASHQKAGAQSGASSAPSAAPPPAAGQSTGSPAPGASEANVAPLPDVSSVKARPGKGKQQSLGEALAQPHGVAASGPRPGNGKQQSLGEALLKPYGVPVAGVTPEGRGVNDGTTKQATGLKMRSLARGEQDAGVNDAARTGGCAPGYGDGRSCLPVAPPSAAQHAGHGVKVAWTCTELLTLFPKGIPLQVRGTDPLGLDEDGNGIACA
ncbi:hypothetical protein HC749_06090 [Arthrobacter sp. S13_S34]|nr:hypothetical protein [Arthrobacter sp. S13_S34]